MAGFRYPNRIVDVARIWPEMMTPKGRMVGRWEQMIALLERRDQALEDYLNTLSGGGEKDWATVLVAASDSHQAGKDSANFVCTGVGDETTLQDAVDSLPLFMATFPIGKIVLLEGTYNLAGVTDLRSGVFTIEGLNTRDSYVSTFINVGAGSFNIFENSTQCTLRAVAVQSFTTGNVVSGTGTFGIDECQMTISGAIGSMGGGSVILTESVIGTFGTSLMSSDTVLAHRCTLSGLSKIFTGSVELFLSDTDVVSLSADYTVDLSFSSGSSDIRISTGSQLVGPVRIVRADAAASVNVQLVDSQFGAVAAAALGNLQEAHSVELVDIAGTTTVTGNVFGAFQSTVPNSFDQLHLRSGAIATGCSEANIVGNICIPRPVSGLNNHRCNINIADAGCTDNIVQFNSTPDCFLDSGTNTQVDPIPEGAAQDSLLWMESKPAPLLANDDTLLWMMTGLY